MPAQSESGPLPATILPMTMPSSDVAVICDVDASDGRYVRMLVRECVKDRFGNAVDDAVLVTDELVTNAQRHGLAPRVCRLALVDDGHCLRIEVTDSSPAAPRIRTPDLYGGRGLILVDRLASSWGVAYHDHYKTVWAELELGPAGHHRHRPQLTAVPQQSPR